MSFSRAELTSFTGATLPDLIDERVRLLFVGYNPGLLSVAAQPKAVLGRQPAGLSGAEVWVVPNPSGRNAHAPLDRLAAAYREPAQAAGLRLVANLAVPSSQEPR